MRRTREQMRLPLPHRPRQGCCESYRHANRAVRPTHEVKVGGRTFLVCERCAQPWESIRGARVEKIQEVAHA